jgi:hypothetical protein
MLLPREVPAEMQAQAVMAAHQAQTQQAARAERVL